MQIGIHIHSNAEKSLEKQLRLVSGILENLKSERKEDVRKRITFAIIWVPFYSQHLYHSLQSWTFLFFFKFNPLLQLVLEKLVLDIVNISTT